MTIACHPVDASFFDAAPMRFDDTVELDARPTDVFAILLDADTWPKWFRGMRKATWTSNEPHGVGSTRTVSVGLLTVEERFFRWEEGRRFSFYLTGQSMSVAHAFAEDYLLEELAPKKTRFTFTVALEPSLAVKLGGPMGRAFFNSTVKGACEGLQSYLLKAKTP